MAGDKFNIRVSSWYKKNGASPGSPNSIATDLVNGLINSLTGTGGPVHGAITSAQLTSSGVMPTSVSDFLSNQPAPGSTKPKAYINWILLDEQFKFVNSSSGAEQVPDESAFGTAPNTHVYPHVKEDLQVTKSGYLYVFVSNETPNIDVFFDNLQVTHIRGPILEETHYYPFGLTMAGISAKALGFGGAENKYKFGGKEFQGELGLDVYDFYARIYMADIGRTTTLDPLAESFASQSPYSFFNNNPVYFKDPTGMASESTHIDKDGNVLAVFDDGDTGVYQHGDNADGNAPTEYQLSKRAEKQGTSSGGTNIGETEHWDEFVSPETGKAMTEYRIQVGKSFDLIIDKLAKEADGMALIEIAKESGPGGKFDVKNDYKNVGGLLNGKYATSRSAGNYLAGYNANNGFISFDLFQKLAGALHVKGSLSNSEKAEIVISGKAYGPAPAYGEVMYQYRMSVQGWSDKGKSGGEAKPTPIFTGPKW